VRLSGTLVREGAPDRAATPRVLPPRSFSSGPPTNTGLGYKTNVPEAEQNELKAIVASTRGDIVV